MSDGQYFVFGTIGLLTLAWVLWRIGRNLLLDYRLKRKLRNMNHGGL
jgi:hypothetical protein